MACGITFNNWKLLFALSNVIFLSYVNHLRVLLIYLVQFCCCGRIHQLWAEILSGEQNFGGNVLENFSPRHCVWKINSRCCCLLLFKLSTKFDSFCI